MALINLDYIISHYLTVKVLGGFCELLGWKSSIQSGNTGTVSKPDATSQHNRFESVYRTFELRVSMS